MCTTLRYAVFTDFEDKIDDAECVQNTAPMQDTRSLTRFFYMSSYGQRTSSWGHTANHENTVSTSAEVTDLMLELILHTTRGIVRLQVCCPIYTYRINLNLLLDPGNESDFTKKKLKQLSR